MMKSLVRSDITNRNARILLQIWVFVCHWLSPLYPGFRMQWGKASESKDVTLFFETLINARRRGARVVEVVILTVRKIIERIDTIFVKTRELSAWWLIEFITSAAPINRIGALARHAWRKFMPSGTLAMLCSIANRYRAKHASGTQIHRFALAPSFAQANRYDRARSLYLPVALVVAVTGCGRMQSAAKQSAIPEDAVERISEKGPVKLAIHVWPSVPRLSDLVSMEIEVQYAQGVEIKPPAFGQSVGDFLIRDYSGKHAENTADANLPNATDSVQIRRFRYQLEPTQAGKHLIRAITIEFLDKREGSENFNSPTIIESEPIEINVTSELGDAVPSLAALEPMFPPRPLDDSSSWWWALLAFPIAGLIGLVVWRRRRQAGAVVEPKALSPAEIARTALAQLLAENLPSQGRVQEFYLRLTGIVRQYIEGTTGVRAPEQTTEEFLRAMRSRQLFGVEQSNRLQDFLEAADMVKYAGQEPTSEQIELSIARAREFVEIPLTKTSDLDIR